MLLTPLQRGSVPSTRPLALQMASSDSPLRQKMLLMLAGATAASLAPALWRRLQRRLQRRRGGMAAAAVDATRSTTSSAGGGAGAYETRKAVEEYLQFHFGQPDEVMPYNVGPKAGAGCRERRRAGERQGPAAAMRARLPLCPAHVHMPTQPRGVGCRMRCGSRKSWRCCASGTAPRCGTLPVSSAQREHVLPWLLACLAHAWPILGPPCRRVVDHMHAAQGYPCMSSPAPHAAKLPARQQARPARRRRWTSAAPWAAPPLPSPAPSRTCWESTSPSTLWTQPT